MPFLECRKLTKCYGGQVVLDRLSWEVAKGQSWAILGPSGAGKSTLLRLLARLEPASAGEITFNAEGPLPTLKPRVGMVFQQLGLWPHLTASKHIECVVNNRSRKARKLVADDVLTDVCLPRDCWGKRPEQLSGGELQRLAIARAIAAKPDILLLDEPLAQVDTMLRAELLELFKRLIAEQYLTSIYVTHSWEEASQAATFVAVIDGGRMVQFGEFSRVYSNPMTPTVALLTGPVVVLPKEILHSEKIHLIAKDAAITMRDADSLIRPQQLQIIPKTESNCWRVANCQAFGVAWRVEFTNGTDQIRTTLCQKVHEGDIVGLAVREMKS